MAILISTLKSKLLVLLQLLVISQVELQRSAEMEELVVGDWLWFPRMGAYTRATASEFNGFPMPEIFVENDSVSLPVEDKGVTRMPPVSAKAFWT